MAGRVVSITLEQARELYKSDNEKLRILALTAYSEEELKPDSYQGIMQEISNKTTCRCLNYPAKEEKTIVALNKLRNIAFFLNKEWKKEDNNIGYFITPCRQDFSYDPYISGWVMAKHCSVKYPGIIYFKDKESAYKAMKIAYKEGWLNDLK